MKKAIIAISIIIVSALAVVVFIGINKNKREEELLANSKSTFRGLPVISLQSSYTFDVDNPNELVGNADYCFLAKVISEDETRYEEIGVSVSVVHPYTIYTVKVIENVKGNLDTDKEIIVKKSGGLLKSPKAYQLYEDDELLEVGKEYFICAKADSKGELLMSGKNSSVFVSEGNEKENIEKYRAAYEKQVVIKRDKHKIKESKVYK
ncbi:MAG: hypothetical protein J6I65_05320 [Lachnospiraceae bacterium]|nr:hypothetical protein [Lachnospiraceae bacterium]